MKAAAVVHALRENYEVRQTIVHTGHYEVSMSDVFFSQLEIPPPDVDLGVGSASHPKQTAEVCAGSNRSF